MKIRALTVVAIAALAVSFASADPGDVLLTFSTPGPDRYADGTTVPDGEWYAVCWTKNASFGGLSTDCRPLVDGDEMILAAPLAKGGKCPLVAFEFARKTAYENGRFSVLLLDTRNANGAVAARGANGLPAFVKGETVAMTTAQASSMEVVAESTASAVGGADGAWGAVALQTENVTGAKITAFEIVGANVQLTVEGLGDGNVVVKTGESVDKMNTFEVPTPVSAGSATFIVPKEKGKFFSVVTVK